MGQYADELFAIWDGKCAGTEHLIEYMKKYYLTPDIIEDLSALIKNETFNNIYVYHY
jgi:hypothetical protein